MTTRIKVTFDMTFTTEGKCEAEVKFSLPDYPDRECPDNLKTLVLDEIRMLAGASAVALKEMETPKQ